MQLYVTIGVRFSLVHVVALVFCCMIYMYNVGSRAVTIMTDCCQLDVDHIHSEHIMFMGVSKENPLKC